LCLDPSPLLRVGREVERQALDQGAGCEEGLQVRGSGREEHEIEGREEGILLVALGLTDHGVRAGLVEVLTREENVVSYRDLLVRLCRRYNFTLIVAN